MGLLFDNNFVLCGSIFFIYVPNKFYLQWLSVDMRYVDLCGILYRQAHKLLKLNHKNEI